MLRFLCLLSLSVVGALPSSANSAAPPLHGSVSFEPNWGQAPAEARFLARGPAVRAAFTNDGAVLVLSPTAGNADRVSLRFLGASPDVSLSGEDQRVERRNFLRNGPAVANVPTFRKLRYQELYAGVDVVFYETNGRLEYDYVTAPGADLEQIVLEFSGRAELDPDTGALHIAGASSAIVQHAPRAFQRGREVEVAYVELGENRFGFSVPDRDPDAELIIDPVVDYSSYLGAGDDDFANAVAVGDDGSIYVAGRTDSDDFPVTAGSLLPTFGGDEGDAFIAKLSADGSQTIWSTYYGSESTDAAEDIAVNSAGEVYVTGWTESENLPVNGFQTQYGGNVDCFVAKLNADGASLAYATYLGHGDEDLCNSIAVDEAGAAYAAGYSQSLDFPVSEDTFQTVNNGGRDAFVVKLSANGGGYAWGTFLGGFNNDTAYAVAVDADGEVYIAGDTDSPDFPLSSDAEQNVGAGDSDAFLAKLSADGTVLMYGSFYGGVGDDLALGLALGPQGRVHVAGETRSSNLPVTIDPIQGLLGGSSDAFLAIFDRDTLQRRVSTYFGAGDRDFANDVAVDSSGRIVVVGGTESVDLDLTPDAVLDEFRGDMDGFLVQFESAGVGVLQSSYYGGENDDEAVGVAVSADRRMYVVGYTRSNNLPLSDNAQQTDFNEDDDINPLDDQPAEGFVVRVSPIEGEGAFSVVSSASFAAGPVAPDSIVTGFAGMNEILAESEEQATSLPLPTALAGVEVRLSDEFGNESAADLFYVSGGQINFAVPAGTAPDRYLAEVLRDGVVVARGYIQVVEVAPALFSADMSGEGPAAALVAIRTGSDVVNEPVFMSEPGGVVLSAVDLAGADEAVLQLYGTGVRGAADVEVIVDGEPVEVLFADAQGEFVGLDQVNVRLPQSLAGAGEVEVQVIADGAASNPVRILLL